MLSRQLFKAQKENERDLKGTYLCSCILLQSGGQKVFGAGLSFTWRIEQSCQQSEQRVLAQHGGEAKVPRTGTVSAGEPALPSIFSVVSHHHRGDNHLQFLSMCSAGTFSSSATCPLNEQEAWPGIHSVTLQLVYSCSPVIGLHVYIARLQLAGK